MRIGSDGPASLVTSLVVCRQPGHYTRFGVTSGLAVIRLESRDVNTNQLFRVEVLWIL